MILLLKREDIKNKMTMNKMGALDKGVQKTLIIVGGVLLAIILIFAFINNFYYSKKVSSTGTATIEVIPDLVAVYFSADTKGGTASEASDRNAVMVDNMKKALILAGVNETEIKTQSFNVYPDYDYSGHTPQITGYTATHSLKVKLPVSEKEKIGQVIDAGVGAGAGVSYINFELNDANEKKYKIEAIKIATEDARDRAKALAEGSGSRLGSLVSVSSSDWGYMPWLAASAESVSGKAGADVATSINPSEQQVSASVTAVFKIR